MCWPCAVLDTGEAFTVGREPVPGPTDSAATHLHDILTALAVLIEQHRDIIEAYRRRTVFDRCGYRLTDILADGVIDLPRLLVGSEGTLALFTEATLRTVPLPGAQSIALLGFASLDDALRAAQLAHPTGPAACELLDRRLLSLARRWRRANRGPHSRRRRGGAAGRVRGRQRRRGRPDGARAR